MCAADMDSKTPVPMEVTLILQDTSAHVAEGPWTEDEGKQTVLAGRCSQSIQVISHELVTEQEPVQHTVCDTPHLLGALTSQGLTQPEVGRSDPVSSIASLSRHHT